MATDSDTKAPAGTPANPVNPAVIAEIFGGRMLSDSFLSEKLIEMCNSGTPEHRIDDSHVEKLYHQIKGIMTNYPLGASVGESDTENDIIYPILDSLEWKDRTAKRDLSISKQDKRQVPDGLLFIDEHNKKQAFAPENEKQPYKFGKLVLENKKWGLPLEDREGKSGAPATQILSYLNRAMVVSDNKIQWGVLTNGLEWRLYYQQADSVADGFFSVRLDVLFGIADQGQIFSTTEQERLACFKIFLLMFCKQSFQPAGVESKILHQSILQEETLHQQRITDNLAEQIFPNIYEKLAKAIAMNSPDASTDDIRMVTLKILFRLLFILFAEDRDLLPLKNDSYKKYSLRHNLRLDIFELATSDKTVTYWCIFKSLCNLINHGEPKFDLPKYNGGLFKDDVDLLTTLEISDTDMLEIIRPLSHIGKTYINYKNLDVEELGAIYEQLLSLTIVKGESKHDIVISGYDRKKSGSYYTPRELVNLAIKETITPLYNKHINVFESKILELIDSDKSDVEKGKILAEFDPAHAVLQQKACDPAMGSGYFLVGLIKYLTDQVITAMERAEDLAPEEWGYESPVRNSIEQIRTTIGDNAKGGGYKLTDEHLKDRHIVKRIVLKKCIYGVDKNPLAVELAKLSLWLHTFTIGAPLSFLDHHLKCGDSLFGLRVEDAIVRVEDYPLLALASGAKEKIAETADKMKVIANMPDAEIEQVEESEKIYEEARKESLKIRKFFSFIHGVEWLRKYKSTAGDKKKIETAFEKIMQQQFSTTHGKNISAIDAVSDTSVIPANGNGHKDMVALIDEALELSNEENFFHWQIEFPEVWKFDNGTAKGGFDIIVGNPPWDKMRLERIEWFADRDADIAKSGTKDRREKKIDALKNKKNPLYDEYIKAEARIKSSLSVLKTSGLYEELNKGDMNIYKIFVERSRQLIGSQGYISLVVPSGIVSDEHSSAFFRQLLSKKQIISFYDFENGRATYNRDKPTNEKLESFFKDVHKSFKFCIFTHTQFANDDHINYGCFLQQMSDIDDDDKCFPMRAEDFSLVNPNTGTVPLFRSKRDKDIVTSIYATHPILDSSDQSVKQSAWKVRQFNMLHASGDSALFKDATDLKKLQAYPIDRGRYENKDGVWLPLYKGAKFGLHDHRAATIISHPDNPMRPLQPLETTPEQHQDPNYFPKPYYWVLENDNTNRLQQEWTVGFRSATASTNERTFITSILPKAAYEHTMAILLNNNEDKKEYLLYANFSTIPFDYIARQKIHATHFAWFILQQLPVIDVATYGTHMFGDKTAEDLIKDIILQLNYTAYDLQGFAEDLGYTGDPYPWDENRRLSLMAKLDAIYFILYGITGDDDIKYIYSTFKITKEKQERQFDRYKSLELCIDYKNALQNGNHTIIYEA